VYRFCFVRGGFVIGRGEGAKNCRGKLPPGHKEKSISACSQDRTVPLGDEEEEEKERGKGALLNQKKARRIEQSEGKLRRKVEAPEGTCHNTRHEAMSHAFPAQPELPDDNR
jgi:hypothetical protein